MKTFKEFPQDSKKVCPICKTKDNKECVLIALVKGNDGEGMNFRATCFHLECIELWYDLEHQIIYQRVKKG